MRALAYAAGVEAALEKFAATRGLKEIRSALAGGNMSRANMLAKTPGVLRPGNALGSEIRDLGAGGEGLATLVAHPQHGISVRKTFDPQGSIYSPELIQRKSQLGTLPGLATHYGSTTTRQDTPVHFNEFVQGQSVDAGVLGSTPGAASAYMKALMQARKAGRSQGYHLADLRGENAKLTPDGQVKFIDHVPLRFDEVQPTNNLIREQRRRGGGQVLPTSPKALRLFNAPPDSFAKHQYLPTALKNPGDFKRMMYDSRGIPSVPSGSNPFRPRTTPGPISEIVMPEGDFL
jgi:hypothetical protein